MDRIGDFSPGFKSEISSEGVKIGRLATYSFEQTSKNFKKHFNLIKEINEGMKNLGRSKVRPSIKEITSLSPKKLLALKDKVSKIRGS